MLTASAIKAMTSEEAEQTVKVVYPAAVAVWREKNGRGWHIANGPNVPGVFQTAGNAWRNAVKAISYGERQ